MMGLRLARAKGLLAAVNPSSTSRPLLMRLAITRTMTAFSSMMVLIAMLVAVAAVTVGHHHSTKTRKLAFVQPSTSLQRKIHVYLSFSLTCFLP
jgi:hypothetical protein